MAVVLAFICLGAAFLFGAWGRNIVSLSATAITPQSIPVAGEAPGTPVAFPKLPPGRLRVARVIDGDTVELVAGFPGGRGDRVRLIGIDAPETGNCFAQEATGALQALAGGRDVRLEHDVNERDKYGRLLAYLYAGDTFVNMRLVEQGDAVAFAYPPDTAHAAEFAAAERIAKTLHRGLWMTCGGLHQGPTETKGDAGPNGCTIKGNISASGERIYHLSGCGSYAKTRIDESAGERWFCSAKEAQDAGWRQAKNC